MSAWLCSDRHLVTVATAIIDNKIVEDMSVLELANALKKENIKSLCARYSDDEGRNAEPITNAMPAPVNAYQLVFAVTSYRYQSCEHDEWKQSKAFAWTRDLLAELAWTIADKHRDVESVPNNGWSL